MPDTHMLIALLKQEQTLRSRHCQILEAQQRALLACDRVRFCALEDEHCALLEKLEAQEKSRRDLLIGEDGAPQTLTYLLEQLDERSRPRRLLSMLRDSLRQTAERIRTLTTRNEMLIRNELNYLAFSLDLFVEAGRSAGQSYGGNARLSGRLGLDRRA